MRETTRSECCCELTKGEDVLIGICDLDAHEAGGNPGEQ
jgi:hypothetical protein